MVSWNDHYQERTEIGNGWQGKLIIASEESNVKVASLQYDDERKVDIYYPSDMNFDKICHRIEYSNTTSWRWIEPMDNALSRSQNNTLDNDTLAGYSSFIVLSANCESLDSSRCEFGPWLWFQVLLLQVNRTFTFFL